VLQSCEEGCRCLPGKHGQNIYWSSPRSSAASAVKDWYSEITDPGYDWRRPGYTSGTGHFTQVIWASTKKVGMATSSDGKYIVANYSPGGNITNAGYFEKNVPPLMKPGAAQIRPLEREASTRNSGAELPRSKRDRPSTSKEVVVAISVTPEELRKLRGLPLRRLQAVFASKSKSSPSTRGARRRRP